MDSIRNHFLIDSNTSLKIYNTPIFDKNVKPINPFWKNTIYKALILTSFIIQFSFVDTTNTNSKNTFLEETNIEVHNNSYIYHIQNSNAESFRFLPQRLLNIYNNQNPSSNKDLIGENMTFVFKNDTINSNEEQFYDDSPQPGIFSIKMNISGYLYKNPIITQTKFDFIEENRKNNFTLDLTSNLIKFLGSFFNENLNSLSENPLYFDYISKNYKKRTILIGIDGLDNSCVNYFNLTAFKYLIENGSYNLETLSTVESLSGPSWSSVLCSLNSKDTGIVNNKWKAPWINEEYKKNYTFFTPINGLDKSFPCIFDELKIKKNASNFILKNKSNLKDEEITDTTSFKYENFTNYVYSSWGFFRDNFGHKAFPYSLDLYTECQIRENIYYEYINCDEFSLDKAKNYVLSDFDFFFWYLVGLDVAGHTSSFCGTEYINRLTRINFILKEFFDYLKVLNLLDKINIIITSDHGSDRGKMSHGNDKYDGNLRVPLFMMGPDFKKNYKIIGRTNLVDIAPTIMKLNNFTSSPLWTGKAINEAFIGEIPRLVVDDVSVKIGGDYLYFYSKIEKKNFFLRIFILVVLFILF